MRIVPGADGGRKHRGKSHVSVTEEDSVDWWKDSRHRVRRCTDRGRMLETWSLLDGSWINELALVRLGADGDRE